MASKLIGRAACPECGFASAHVKKSEKCVYRYCPECGSQHHARTERQSADLMAKTRPEAGASVEAPTVAKPSPSPSPTGSAEPTGQEHEAPTPTASETTPTPTAPKRRGLFT